MDSRERVFLALDRKPTDRIPIDFWASRALIDKLTRAGGTSYNAFLDNHDVDLRYIAGPDYVGPSLEMSEPGLSRDIWGVVRRAVRAETAQGTESYDEVSDSPLARAASAEEVDAYTGWPSPDWFRYDTIESQCDAIRNQGRVVVFMGDRLNRIAQLKPAMYLRGVEEILIDVAMQPEIAEAIFRNVRNFYAAYMERILEAANGKIDIVLTGDDFGSQNGLLISPAMWDTFLREGFERYMRMIHDAGARSMHHTCGSVRPLIPRLIDCGLDILQSIQPESHEMGLAALKADFGDRLAFQGGVSIQDTMPFGTPESIDAEVERIASIIGSSGGYIFCTSHNIQADTPLENVEALMRAYHRHGRL